MSLDENVTRWIQQLKAGEREVVEKLWRTCHQRLLAYARKNLDKVPRTGDEPEDVALSAFKSFCLRAEKGRFAHLEDRDDLWQLLLVIAHRKAQKRVEYATRERRDVRRLEDGNGAALAGLCDKALDPAFAVQVAEEYERLLAELNDDELRHIVMSKMEGYTNEEIARQREVSLATVERRLKLTRKVLRREVES